MVTTTTPGATPGDGDLPLHVPVQEELPLDEPVPFRLTARGRRLVAPGDVPVLRVVEDQGGHPATVPVRHVDLDGHDGSVRARVRALRRAGQHTLDIAEELGVDPLHVEAWVSDLPVPAAAAGRRRRPRAVPDPDDGPTADAPTSDGPAVWRAARAEGADEAGERFTAEPSLVAGLALVTGLLAPDQHALVLVSDQEPVLRAAWSWLVTTFGLEPAWARALALHDPDVAGDRVAHDVVGTLGIDLAHVATSRDRGRAGRPPLVRVRVTDAALSGRVAGWRDALLAEVGRHDG